MLRRYRMAATIAIAASVATSLGTAHVARGQGGTVTITRGESEPNGKPDSTFRAALTAMARGDEQAALIGFSAVALRYPKSTYAPTSMYNTAFLLYRRYHTGDSTQSLRAALAVLIELQKRYPQAPRITDAQTLQTRICGTLASRGDRMCEQEVLRTAHPGQIAPPTRTARRWTVTIQGDSTRAAVRTDSSACRGLNIGAVAAALSGLWKTDTTQAIRAMQRIVPTPRPCLDGLRIRAILTMMGHQVPSLVPMMLEVARSDTSAVIRRRAYLWLTSQPRDARLAATLDTLANVGVHMIAVP